MLMWFGVCMCVCACACRGWPGSGCRQTAPILWTECWSGSRQLCSSLHTSYVTHASLYLYRCNQRRAGALSRCVLTRWRCAAWLFCSSRDCRRRRRARRRRCKRGGASEAARWRRVAAAINTTSARSPLRCVTRLPGLPCLPLTPRGSFCCALFTRDVCSSPRFVSCDSIVTFSRVALSCAQGYGDDTGRF
jgi:hypothetical protein